MGVGVDRPQAGGNGHRFPPPPPPLPLYTPRRSHPLDASNPRWISRVWQEGKRRRRRRTWEDDTATTAPMDPSHGSDKAHRKRRRTGKTPRFEPGGPLECPPTGHSLLAGNDEIRRTWCYTRGLKEEKRTASMSPTAHACRNGEDADGHLSHRLCSASTPLPCRLGYRNRSNRLSPPYTLLVWRVVEFASWRRRRND